MRNPINEAIQLTDDEGRTFEKDKAALKYYFDKFNKTYFNGVLAPIPLDWMKGTRLHGYFSHKTDMINRKFIPVCIKLNLNACGTYAAFRNVFVHEMLHYYVNCYTELPPENWDFAIRRAALRDRTAVRRALRCSDETCHQYEWKRLADKLSEDYPELGNIERYAVKNNETGVALMDKDYIAQWAMKNVMLKQEFRGKTYYYIISVNNSDWKSLQEALSQGMTNQGRFAGKWTRLFSALDPQDFVQMRTLKDMGRYYYSIPSGMIRREKELGFVVYDIENASKSGMSQEAIDKWRNDYVILVQTTEYGRKKVFVIKRNVPAVNNLLSNIRNGGGENPLFNGEWDMAIPTRDPKYFVAFSASKDFKYFYDFDRLMGKPNFVDHVIHLGKYQSKI